MRLPFQAHKRRPRKRDVARKHAPKALVAGAAAALAGVAARLVGRRRARKTTDDAQTAMSGEAQPITETSPETPDVAAHAIQPPEPSSRPESDDAALAGTDAGEMPRPADAPRGDVT
jgi:hypothetical protein